MIAELEKAHREERERPLEEDERTRRRRKAKEASERARKLAQRSAAKDKEMREATEALMHHLAQKVRKRIDV